MGENKRKVGSEYEKKAVMYLLSNGYEIIEQNFFCRYGEIDIIARNEGYLVFVEVKYRKNDRFGMPQESVSLPKQKKIIGCARYYCYKNKTESDCPIRFDVVAILGNDVQLIKNAFMIT